MHENFEDEFTGAFDTVALKGRLVQLYGLNESDAEGAFELLEESREHLMEHLPWAQTATFADVCRMVRGWLVAKQLSQGGCWKIMDIESERVSKLPAGFIMMDVHLASRSATVSYWLGKNFTGRGLMTDALRTLCQFCFERLRLNRLEVDCFEENLKSIAVARRVGFVEEGVSREAEFFDGVYRNVVRLGLLKSEFKL